MQSKPKQTYTISVNKVDWFFSVFEENEDSNAFEGLIDVLGKLQIASTYYDDYGASDRFEFIRLIKTKAKVWRLAEKIIRDGKRRFIPGLRSLPHQLGLDQELVEQIDKCRCPSSFLVDSS